MSGGLRISDGVSEGRVQTRACRAVVFAWIVLASAGSAWSDVIPTSLENLPPVPPQASWTADPVFWAAGLELALGLALLLLSRRPRFRAYGAWAGLALVALGIATAVVVPNVRKAYHQRKLTGCKSNLKDIATSIEMYSIDNAGLYPTGLSVLIPKYLKAIPRCPAAQSDTYSQSYQWSQIPNAYTVRCMGLNHRYADVAWPNFPGYGSYGFLVGVTAEKQCQSHVSDLAVSLKAYATDNQGHYPPDLNHLTPYYLKAIPQCPLAGNGTYVQGYSCAASPDAFTITCGAGHGEVWLESSGASKATDEQVRQRVDSAHREQAWETYNTIRARYDKKLLDRAETARSVDQLKEAQRYFEPGDLRLRQLQSLMWELDPTSAPEPSERARPRL